MIVPAWRNDRLTSCFAAREKRIVLWFHTSGKGETIGRACGPCQKALFIFKNLWNIYINSDELLVKNYKGNHCIITSSRNRTMPAPLNLNPSMGPFLFTASQLLEIITFLTSMIIMFSVFLTIFTTLSPSTT